METLGLTRDAHGLARINVQYQIIGIIISKKSIISLEKIANAFSIPRNGARQTRFTPIPVWNGFQQSPCYCPRHAAR